MRKYYIAIICILLSNSAIAQNINFPDATFKQLLLDTTSNSERAFDLNGNSLQIDQNSDGEIQLSEALLVGKLYVGPTFGALPITDLTGISYFVNLTLLNCSSNQIVNLDVSSNTSLITLWCFNNQLLNLNLANCSQLVELYSYDNQLVSLNTTGLTSLKFLNSYDNLITGLDLSTNNMLIYINLKNNRLNSLNLNNQNYNYVNLEFNLLETLFIKNASVTSVYIQYNPTLKYICCSDAILNFYQNIVNGYGLGATCQVNSYCTFTPAGNFNAISGVTKFDNNSNGCDVLDSAFTNMKFNIIDSQGTTGTISSSSGNYSVYTGSGTHTITPVLENPTYFSVTPATATVNFIESQNTVIQNFCVSPVGIHKDLQIDIIPLEIARPGFNCTYKILFKNKGFQPQSGIIKLTFNDAVLDFVSSNPATVSQTTNNLTWNFSDLGLLETNQITVTLNLNSPMETPAVNAGFLLNFTATIIGAIDETPFDNIATLNQTVVNSFDPNDKTCLQGAIIIPSQVGKYVNYMIRFENNGTANAQNIVVKDIIDIAKFDVNSLIPINGSHSFVTKITNTNKVEFIFENINLPFDDANNDGYIAFKIKTKPTLVLGNTFSNTASIYFDYNFPIVTNTTITTVSNVLSNQDFEFASYFAISPNPAKDFLNITTKQDIEISSLSIYNVLGQVMQVIPNAKDMKTIDVSDLKSCNYFVKVISDKGTSSSKFLKE